MAGVIGTIFECLNEKQNGFIRGWKENEKLHVRRKINRRTINAGRHSFYEGIKKNWLIGGLVENTGINESISLLLLMVGMSFLIVSKF